MDIDGLERLLRGIESGEIRVVARDLTEPSPLALEVLSARPYAYLDDAPLEERRTQAVMSRRWLAPEDAAELGRLDPEAIARVRERGLARRRQRRRAARRAGLARLPDARRRRGAGLERLARRTLARAERAWRSCDTPAARCGSPPSACRTSGRSGRDATLEPPIARAGSVPERAGRARRRWSRSCAAAWRVWGRSREAALAAPLGLAAGDREPRWRRSRPKASRCAGASRRAPAAEEWCERRLLARIHRYTVKRLRAEIEPVAARDFLRFLLDWQRVAAEARMEGPDALEAWWRSSKASRRAAGAWETELLPARIAEYEPAWLDDHCLAGPHRLGAAAAAQRRGRNGDAPQRARCARTPIALLARRHAALWAALSTAPDAAPSRARARRRVADCIRAHGASFFDELVEGTGLLRTQVEEALGELVALGLVTSDSFGGLRALLVPSDRRKPFGGAAPAPRPHRSAWRTRAAGRSRAAPAPAPSGDAAGAAPRPSSIVARTLLRRYGVVFWRLLEREADWLPPWRDLLRVYRRLEARGEIRGGRFVAGFSGEQFALPEAVATLREARRKPASDALVSLSGADPLNLVGILTPGAAARGADRQPPALPRRPADRLPSPAARSSCSRPSSRRRNGTRARRCCAAPTPASRSRCRMPRRPTACWRQKRSDLSTGVGAGLAPPSCRQRDG